jgi:hypothetical protein
MAPIKAPFFYLIDCLVILKTDSEKNHSVFSGGGNLRLDKPALPRFNGPCTALVRPCTQIAPRLIYSNFTHQFALL